MIFYRTVACVCFLLAMIRAIIGDDTAIWLIVGGAVILGITDILERLRRD